MRFKRVSISYLLKQGFLGFIRNGFMSVASILILISCMIVLGSFYMIVENIDDNFKDDKLYMIDAFVDYETPDSELPAIEEQIKKLSYISEYKLITREDALKSFKDTHSEAQDVLEQFDSDNNPLPPSFRIYCNEPDKLTNLVYNLESIEGIDNVQTFSEAYQTINGIKKAVTIVGIWMMVILLLVAFIVIINSIKITVFARRDEIRIMRYIGATDFFVVFPFVVEGIIIGILSTATALGIQYYLYQRVIVNMVGQYVTMSDYSKFLPILTVMFCVIGVFAGIIASIISVKRYMKEG